MRRNTNRGGKFGNDPGPLLTNHLRDLDMELELLKRKREIFQQEQDILNRFSNNNKRQFDNKQPFYTFNQPTASPIFNVNSNSNTYQFGNSYNPRPQGTKRQSNSPWQNQNPTPPKRFNDQHRINPWLVSEPRQDYRPVQTFNPPQTKTFTGTGQIKALMDLKPSISQRIKKFVPPPRKNFNPTKVTKPKNKNVTEQLKKNNGNAKSVAQTAKPVKEPAPQVPKKSFQDNVLRLHKPPSVQMKGRLELALGTIVKCVKELCTDPTTLEYFMIPFIQRVIKHTLRLRIRDVMMNKPVDSVSVIVDKYREIYPKETDVELMKVAEDAHKFNTNNQRVLQLIEADDPEEFFKKNLTRLLNEKLDEAFDALKNVYKNKNYDFDKCVEGFPKESDFSKDVQVQDESDVVIIDESQYSVKGDKNRMTVCSTDVKTINDQLEEKSANTKKYVEFMDELIENRLPKILPRYKDMIMSLLCIDKEFLSLKAFIANDTKQKLKKAMESDDKVITIDDDAEIREKSKAPSAEPASVKPEQKADAVIETPIVAATSTIKVEPPKTEENVSSIVTTGMATVTPSIPSPSAEQDVKPVSPITLLKQTVPTTPAKDAEKITPIPITPASKDIQYIKLIGRPNLPARNDIYEFLNKYKPTSIKKHKTINNLLVVGFSNKEAFENILKANETVIGDATIIIKASEQGNNLPVQIKTNEQGKETAARTNVNEQATKTTETETEKSVKTTVKTEIPDTADKLNASDDIISSDLDTQITDLLSSIRQANEEDEASKNSSEEMDATDIKEEKNEMKENNDVDIKEMPEKVSDTEVLATDNSQDVKPAKELETIAEIDDAASAEGEAKSKIVEDIAKTNVNESGRATPTRSSSRLAVITPSTIKTRRASRLANNN